MKYQLQEKSLQEKYDTLLQPKDEQIAYYKDFKLKQSTISFVRLVFKMHTLKKIMMLIQDLRVTISIVN